MQNQLNEFALLKYLQATYYILPIPQEQLKSLFRLFSFLGSSFSVWSSSESSPSIVFSSLACCFLRSSFNWVTVSSDSGSWSSSGPWRLNYNLHNSMHRKNDFHNIAIPIQKEIEYVHKYLFSHKYNYNYNSNPRFIGVNTVKSQHTTYVDQLRFLILFSIIWML